MGLYVTLFCIFQLSYKCITILPLFKKLKKKQKNKKKREKLNNKEINKMTRNSENW